MISRRFTPVTGLIVLPNVLYAQLLNVIGSRGRAIRTLSELGNRARPDFISEVVFSIANFHMLNTPNSRENWEMCYEYMKTQSTQKPRSASVWIWLSVMQREMGSYTEACVSIDRAEMLIGGVRSYELLYQRGLLANKTGNIHGAIDCFKEILERGCCTNAPGCAEFNVKRALANAHWMLGDEEESIRAYADIVRMHRKNDFFVPDEIKQQVIALVTCKEE